MSFKSIWTNPTLRLRERLERTRELAWMTAAAHLPRKLAYWSYIHVGVEAIRGNEIVPDVRYTEILERIPR